MPQAARIEFPSQNVSRTLLPFSSGFDLTRAGDVSVSVCSIFPKHPIDVPTLFLDECSGKEPAGQESKAGITDTSLRTSRACLVWQVSYLYFTLREGIAF
jgi:hypothetical protein